MAQPFAAEGRVPRRIIAIASSSFYAGGSMSIPFVKLRTLLGSVAVISLGTTGAALAQPFNEGPPSGALYDLAGQTIDHGAAVEYSTSFVASSTSTEITFAFRDDPAFLFFSNSSVSTGGGPNLLLNGNFMGGTYSMGANGAIPDDWTFQNQYNATFFGMVESGEWVDGSVQAYDSLSQYITTVIGQTYTISFFLTEDSGDTTYQDLSTNGDITDTGGNGIDVLTYTTANFNINQVPEPASFVVLAAGLLGLAAMRRTQARDGGKSASI
jgi:hypothetical protein